MAVFFALSVYVAYEKKMGYVLWLVPIFIIIVIGKTL